jgi:hypothetical protein
MRATAGESFRGPGGVGAVRRRLRRAVVEFLALPMLVVTGFVALAVAALAVDAAELAPLHLLGLTVLRPESVELARAVEELPGMPGGGRGLRHGAVRPLRSDL